jgi:hypothetical protein
MRHSYARKSLDFSMSPSPHSPDCKSFDSASAIEDATLGTPWLIHRGEQSASTSAVEWMGI